MSDPNDNSIPILQEVLVPGHAAQRREPASGGDTAPAAPAASAQASPAAAAATTTPAGTVTAAPAAAQTASQTADQTTGQTDTPLREAEALYESELAAEPDLRAEPEFAAEPELAPQPVLSPEETRAPEPVLAPRPAAVAAHSAAHAQPKSWPDDAHRAAEAEHAHDEVLAASAGVFDRTEPPPPLEAGATVPPDIAQDGAGEASSGVDAELIAGRLRERFAGFLAGDGRAIVEARCRSAVEEHATRLVDQVTREVVSALENEITGWVSEAVEAEIARRTPGA